MTTQSLFLATSDSQDITNLVSQLPKETWFEEYDLYQCQGSWFLSAHLEGTLAVQKFFQARDDDIILASPPIAGTTWLKSLVPCIINCPRDDNNDPFMKNNPHGVVLTLDAQIYLKTIINPKDVFVSLWHFMNTTRTQEQGPFPIDKAFESFCNGIQFYGPNVDHALDYWNASFKLSKKIFFLKYEEMKKNPKEQVLELASFLGKSFANDEELDNVLWRSSFERLKNLAINKSGVERHSGLANSSFFRLGTIGDWKNNFTPDVQERLDQIIRLKYKGFGLDLEI
ncbi:hypothetical protein AQUCO_11600002v1 [Aquilegia coerulea]|uniref:Sulfotransferase n=1 Tax=Aquilegia coerulea TaxID=218851 RepID=A0A2G5C3J2_AQUCA|nr:hypothetical protein AQUCO_11600002v1 [Aquilegia coerulea]